MQMYKNSIMALKSGIFSWWIFGLRVFVYLLLLSSLFGKHTDAYFVKKAG